MRITLKRFINDCKDEIDEFIRENSTEEVGEITNEIREKWLRENKRLNLWACYEEVVF